MSTSGDASEVAMLRALAHPVRLGIMRRLAARPETCACDFTELFTVSQPTISQHLKVLREAGLVHTRRRGTQICYSTQPGNLLRLQDLLAALHPDLSLANPSGT
jgi:ArsR family transcriptional regulator, arsenate/arsenite/antimonite-responsive transcriptional repressor